MAGRRCRHYAVGEDVQIGIPGFRYGKKSRFYTVELVPQDGIIPYLCAVVSVLTIIPAGKSYITGFADRTVPGVRRRI